MTNRKEVKKQILDFLEEIPDPEIPVINIVEMGIVRGVVFQDGKWEVLITPTYSGCPAMVQIEEDILKELRGRGFENAVVKRVFSPAWTTDWFSDTAREKLRKYGISPPGKSIEKVDLLKKGNKSVHCPRCNSSETELVSLFGSTACKALYKCKSCLEPFDHFKCV